MGALHQPRRQAEGPGGLELQRPAVSSHVAEPSVGGVVPPRKALLAAACGYLAALYLSSLAGAVWASASGRRESLGQIVSVLVTQWAGLMAAAVFASRRWGTGRLGDDLGVRARPADLIVGVLAALFSQVLVWLLYLPLDLDVSKEARRLLGLAHGPGLVLLGACVIVGAPIVEEVFFRGLLQGALVQRFGPSWGVAGASVAFGVSHYQPVQLLGLVAFGLVLGVLRLRTGRLGASVVAHMAFNAATFTLFVASR